MHVPTACLRDPHSSQEPGAIGGSESTGLGSAGAGASPRRCRAGVEAGSAARQAQVVGPEAPRCQGRP